MLLNDQHLVKDWYSMLETFLTVQGKDKEEFETLKTRAMVDLTGGVTPCKRSKYAESVLDETMAWGVQLPPMADRTTILNEFNRLEDSDLKKMVLLLKIGP